MKTTNSGSLKWAVVATPLAVVVTLATTWVWGQAGHRDHAISKTPDTQAAPAADDRVSELEARVRELEHRPAASPQPKPTVKVVASAASSADAPPPEKRPTITVQGMQTTVESESKDAAWAPQYERNLSASFAQNYPDERITDLDCRTSMCRLKVQSESTEKQEAFLSHFWVALPSGFAGAWSGPPGLDEKGAPSSLIYIVRQGHESEVIPN
jgi:hypothetical protein